MAGSCAYDVRTVTVKEGTGLTLGHGDQAFYKGTEHRNQYGTWHSFVVLSACPGCWQHPAVASAEPEAGR